MVVQSSAGGRCFARHNSNPTAKQKVAKDVRYDSEETARGGGGDYRRIRFIVQKLLKKKNPDSFLAIDVFRVKAFTAFSFISCPPIFSNMKATPPRPNEEKKKKNLKKNTTN